MSQNFLDFFLCLLTKKFIQYVSTQNKIPTYCTVQMYIYMCTVH